MELVEREDVRELKLEKDDQKKVERILRGFIMHRMDIGYVRGMGHLVILLLNIIQDEYQTFECFINLIHSHHFLPFFRADIPQVIHYLIQIIRYNIELISLTKTSKKYYQNFSNNSTYSNLILKSICQIGFYPCFISNINYHYSFIRFSFLLSYFQ